MPSIRVIACRELEKLGFVDGVKRGYHYTHSAFHGGVDINVKCAINGKTRVHLLMKFHSPEQAIKDRILWDDNTTGIYKVVNITTQKKVIEEIRKLFLDTDF